MADNANLAEFPDGHLALDIHAAIDVRRVSFTTGDRVVSLEGHHSRVFASNESVLPGADVGLGQFLRRRLALGDHLQRPTNKPLGDAHGDTMLCGHRKFATLLAGLGGQLLLHLAGHRAVLAGVSKNAQTLKAGLFDELNQGLEMSRRLARETHDEGRSQCDARDAGPDPGDEVANVLPRSFTAHPCEHVVVNMLQGHVHIPGHLGALGDGPDQLVGPVGRVGVEQSDPEVPLQRVQFTQQRAQRGGIDR